MPVNQSYPKPRSVLQKVFAVARTDNSTVKCVLPKHAVVTGVYVDQDVNAATAAATFNVGWTGATTALLNGFTMATSKVGFVTAGTAAGTGICSKLTEDKNVICTYVPGSSTAGGTGFVVIKYFVAGPGEAVTD